MGVHHFDVRHVVVALVSVLGVAQQAEVRPDNLGFVLLRQVGRVGRRVVVDHAFRPTPRRDGLPGRQGHGLVDHFDRLIVPADLQVVPVALVVDGYVVHRIVEEVDVDQHRLDDKVTARAVDQQNLFGVPLPGFGGRDAVRRQRQIDAVVENAHRIQIEPILRIQHEANHDAVALGQMELPVVALVDVDRLLARVPTRDFDGLVVDGHHFAGVGADELQVVGVDGVTVVGVQQRHLVVDLRHPNVVAGDDGDGAVFVHAVDGAADDAVEVDVHQLVRVRQRVDVRIEERPVVVEELAGVHEALGLDLGHRQVLVLRLVRIGLAVFVVDDEDVVLAGDGEGLRCLVGPRVAGQHVVRRGDVGRLDRRADLGRQVLDAEHRVDGAAELRIVVGRRALAVVQTGAAVPPVGGRRNGRIGVDGARRLADVELESIAVDVAGGRAQRLDVAGRVRERRIDRRIERLPERPLERAPGIGGRQTGRPVAAHETQILVEFLETGSVEIAVFDSHRRLFRRVDVAGLAVRVATGFTQESIAVFVELHEDVTIRAHTGVGARFAGPRAQVNSHYRRPSFL